MDKDLLTLREFYTAQIIKTDPNGGEPTLHQIKLDITGTGPYERILEMYESRKTVEQAATNGLSPLTPGTMSTSTPASRTPSSSSTNSGSSEVEPGPRPSSKSPDTTTGCC